jgi:hypothetical protein
LTGGRGDERRYYEGRGGERWGGGRADGGDAAAVGPVGGRRGGGKGRHGKKEVRKKMMLRWAINGLEVGIAILLPEGI